jgi:hypothetical protein
MQPTPTSDTVLFFDNLGCGSRRTSGYIPPALTQSQDEPIAGFGYEEGGFPRERVIGPYSATNLEGFGVSSTWLLRPRTRPNVSPRHLRCRRRLSIGLSRCVAVPSASMKPEGLVCRSPFPESSTQLTCALRAICSKRLWRRLRWEPWKTSQPSVRHNGTLSIDTCSTL